VLNTPVDRIGCSLVGELRVPARDSSLSVLPSPLSGRVGVHITTFEACSSFTRVTACRVAHPPYVGFIARLRPGRFPGSGARKLPSSTNNLLGWVLPPLVICAVEAHPITPCFVHNAVFEPEIHRIPATECNCEQPQLKGPPLPSIPNNFSLTSYPTNTNTKAKTAQSEQTKYHLAAGPFRRRNMFARTGVPRKNTTR
jgi:hypothetical protein